MFAHISSLAEANPCLIDTKPLINVSWTTLTPWQSGSALTPCRSSYSKLQSYRMLTRFNSLCSSSSHVDQSFHLWCVPVIVWPGYEATGCLLDLLVHGFCQEEKRKSVRLNKWCTEILSCSVYCTCSSKQQGSLVQCGFIWFRKNTHFQNLYEIFPPQLNLK